MGRGHGGAGRGKAERSGNVGKRSSHKGVPLTGEGIEYIDAVRLVMDVQSQWLP